MSSKTTFTAKVKAALGFLLGLVIGRLADAVQLGVFLALLRARG